ncbi:MAG TPA: FMN-binding negative transcriptional regulator, partial [Kribbella sp.]
MYVPAHFAGEDEAVQELLYSRGAADLVTATPEGLVATMLPFLYDRERSVLLGHLARNNEHWKLPVIGDALVIMRGPDAYISPTWYASKQEHGRVVPTWNYITAHIHGTMTVHDDPAWVEDVVR